ncbi:sigma-E processing peptidase SpoIIGA [Tissierella sp. MSJ-40]|uniref:Sporulation sigma-E factor-processing peptidase n=1 Tax=Tissierella simiarum TaxID=2841534 RepID=A0ABS6E5G5_9FIRM|nr:sigma-E processing peptidase SpoIIGA [Tissierella simiarum]MBU5438168.1 sigma-E processing peptidase SpoIIGA [Tissierella simiarum]
MYIFAEYLLIENAIINYIILYVAKSITRTKTTRLRMLLAAIVGSIYTLVFFFPSLQFMTKFSIKFCLSILIIILAFNPNRLNLFLKQISAFYVVSFIFAGASIGIYFISNNTPNSIFKLNIKGFPVKYLILGIVVATILIKNILKYYFVKVNKENYLTKVTVALNQKKAYFTALIDTGNSLKEPITKTPVIIAEFEALDYILPSNVIEMYMNNRDKDLEHMGKIMDEVKDKMVLRLIPYKSIGNTNGMIIGFKPDYVVISFKDGRKEINKDIIVGIYNEKLSTDHQYNGLLHPEILGQGEQI